MFENSVEENVTLLQILVGDYCNKTYHFFGFFLLSKYSFKANSTTCEKFKSSSAVGYLKHLVNFWSYVECLFS